LGQPMSAMIKDDEKCIRCGLCAIRCPTDAMTMEVFHYEEREAIA
jgi:ferredoxin